MKAASAMSRVPPASSDPRLVVFDVGARFGIHPSWQPISRSPLLDTHAFEPDLQEAERLAAKYSGQPNYHVTPLAFGDSNGPKSLHLLAHRGQSSFLRPNLEGAWFGVTRQEEGRIESTRECQMRRLDDWCLETGLYPDFLKTDTEGYDYEVLKGGERVVRERVLGLRCEVLFQQTFVGTGEFDQIFRFMRDRDFVLANLDYDGKGSAQSYFCPTPKFGLLTGCEAVFVREPRFYRALSSTRFLKALIFLFLNGAADVAVPCMLERRELLGDGAADAPLRALTERLFLLGAKRLQTQPGSNFDRAKADYEQVFGRAFPDMHRFYESELLNPA